MKGTITSQWNTHSLTRALYSHNTHIAPTPHAPVSNTEPEPKHSTVYTTLNWGGVRRGTRLAPHHRSSPHSPSHSLSQSQTPTRRGQVVSIKLSCHLFFADSTDPRFSKCTYSTFYLVLSRGRPTLTWTTEARQIYGSIETTRTGPSNNLYCSSVNTRPRTRELKVE